MMSNKSLVAGIYSSHVRLTGARRFFDAMPMMVLKDVEKGEA